jgi:HD-GYP domain-containing protein (c-di-GMP phosphodiesterase class II)
MIPVGRIRLPDDLLGRGDEDIDELAASIRKHGLLHPLLVRPVRRDYEVVSGYRRLRACRKLRMGEIPAFVRNIDDREALEIRLAENARRAGLTREEQERLLERLQKLYSTRDRSELERWVREDRPGEEPPPPPEPKPEPEPEPPPEPAKKPEADPIFAREASRVLFEDREKKKRTTERPVAKSKPAITDLPHEQEPGPRTEPTLLATPEESKQPTTVPPPQERERTTMIGLPRDRKKKKEPPPEPEKEPGPKPKPKDRPYPKKMVAKVKRILNRVARYGHLDIKLLDLCTSSILKDLEEKEPVDFLDLDYEEPPERYLPRHSVNVAKLAAYVGRSIGYSREEQALLCMAGILHDVGLFRVPRRILRKSAPLTAKEANLIQMHPEHGAAMLELFPELDRAIIRCTREHHERPNRHGYPNGLELSETHRFARLMMVVNAYEALVSPRVYKLSILPHRAIGSLKEETLRGEYDADSVEALVKALSLYPIGTYLRMKEGQIARVVRSNPDAPDRPMIQLVADRDMNLLDPPIVIDLRVDPGLTFDAIRSP